jgi:hypothetical protein
MKHARIAMALVAAAGTLLAARVAQADCTDPSCPKEVSQAMQASALRRPFVFSFAVRSLSYLPSAHDRFDGHVQSSPMGYQFSGDELGGSTIRTFGAELGADYALTPLFYAGAAAAWGEGAWSATPFAAGNMTLQPRGTVDTHMWLTGARVGARLPLGPVSVRAELLAGAQWMEVDQLAQPATGSQTMTGSARTVTWLLEPRAAVDLWTTPYLVVSAFGTMPGFESRAANGGLLFAWHWRSFDGRYSGVL